MSRRRSNQARVQALRAKGWTNSSIGRALGRDHSLIRQIGAGTKPGANLTQGLAQLEKRKNVPGRGGKPKPTAAARPLDLSRRRGATGQPAAVRTPATIFPSGVQIADARTRRTKTMRRAIERAAAAGQKVSLTLGFRSVKGYGGSGSWSATTDVAGPARLDKRHTGGRGEVRLSGRHAVDAGELLERIDAAGGNDWKVFVELANETPGIESARGLTSVSLSTSA